MASLASIDHRHGRELSNDDPLIQLNQTYIISYLQVSTWANRKQNRRSIPTILSPQTLRLKVRNQTLKSFLASIKEVPYILKNVSLQDRNQKDEYFANSSVVAMEFTRVPNQTPNAYFHEN